MTVGSREYVCEVVMHGVSCEYKSTIPLCESKLVISRSCLILVLTTVLGRPRRADVKNGVKNYHGPTTSLENAIPKHLNFIIPKIKNQTSSCNKAQLALYCIA
jgi:hypothetical protein